MASTLFDTVRSSCAWVARNATDCEVSLPDIDKFLSALVEDEFVKAISPSQPFVFGSQATATKVCFFLFAPPLSACLTLK